MGEAPGAAAVLGAAALAKGGRRAGGGGVGEAVGEAVVGDAGEAQAEPLAGDAGEAVVGVVGVVGESGVGTRGGGVSHRGRLLEFDIDTTFRCVSDGLLGLRVQIVVLQAVAGRSQGGMRWVREHARTHESECSGVLRCQRALTERRTLRAGSSAKLAYRSTCSVELPLSPAARAAPPSGPRSLRSKLRARERGSLVLRTVSGR